MADPKEIPQLVGDLVDLSKDYLRQETIEPAKRLGRFAGFGFAGGALFAAAALLATLGLFTLLRRVLPETVGWSVLARLFTGVAAAGGAALVGWRMTK